MKIIYVAHKVTGNAQFTIDTGKVIGLCSFEIQIKLKSNYWNSDVP